MDSLVGPPTVVNTTGTGVWIADDAFVGVQSSEYWSSTVFNAGLSMAADLGVGIVGGNTKTLDNYVWPVRGQ